MGNRINTIGMYEITYYSLARTNLRADDISAILNTSRNNNLKDNITGCLLYHKNQFIQILEGEKVRIDELLTKIKRDDRHSFFYLLSEGEKEERTFPTWTMAYRKISDDDLKSVNESLFISNFLTFASLCEKPTHTIKLFWNKIQQLLTDDFTT